MNFNPPAFPQLSENAFIPFIFHSVLRFPEKEETQSLLEWAFEVAKRENIEACQEYYKSVINSVNPEQRCIIINVLLASLNEEDFELENEVKTMVMNSLTREFHIHESTIYAWAIQNPEEEKYNPYIIQKMRNLFESRYLTSITYTFEAPENQSLYYDTYKITCFVDIQGTYGNLEIHNKQKDDWHTHYFEVSAEHWAEIAFETKKIDLIPEEKTLTIRRYFSDVLQTGNHILELHNASHTLFYRSNWNETKPNIASPEFNFNLKDLLLNTVDRNIDEIAKEKFPLNIDFNTMSSIEIINHNSASWDAEFKFLEEIITTRYDFHFGNNTRYRSIYEIPLPKINEYSTLGALIKGCNFGFEERVILALTMAPHLRPQSLDKFFTRNKEYERTFSEAGGIKGRFHSGYLPTLETALFLLAGKDISKKIQIISYIFGENSTFIKNNILKIEVKEQIEPLGAGQLVISKEYLEFLTTGNVFRPTYNSDFPAELLTTELEWKDLYLENETTAEIQNIETWLSNQHKIMHELKLKKHLKLGYRALFYGSSGTGKTLTATLLGKNLGLDVYRVDLSMITSKYIGETTKNLARLFDVAENKNWILFFDEAESLFGKRSQNIERASDSYYNQEVGYLLQRIENYDGLVILATNLLDNIDTAFMRRFQSLVHFPVPSPTQQLALWKNIFSNGLPLAKNINLKFLSENYVLTASNITNILRDATIKTLQSKEPKITKKTLTDAIQRELKKANLRESIGFKK